MKNIFGAIVFRDVLKWRSLRANTATQWRSLHSKSRKKNIRIKDLNSALKPFFFMVHPDLFGNFPEKRDVNEESLKKLNSFLQTLVKTGPRNGSVSLKFFVRDPKQPDLDSISAISVNLCGSTSPSTEVEKILKSAGLPGLFSNRERVNTKLPSCKDRPIQHHMDKKDKDDGTIPKETLLTFLQQKAPLAKVHLAKTTKLKKQISMLNEKICHDFGFKSLSVECNWRILLVFGFLKNFYLLLERHRNDIQKASGWKVILGSWGGIDSEGVINLNIEDEPLTWIWLLTSVDRYSKMLLEVQHLKSAISQMLGGLTILDMEYNHKKHHLEEFRASLNDLYFNLKSTTGLKVDLQLDNYKGIITWCVKKTPILPSGLFLIPLSMDGFEIISFLATSVAQARKAKEAYQRELLKEKQIIDLCIKHLQLQSLSRSTSINHFEMISCCENLVDISCTITESLVVKVDRNYYASADGELTIPWNWKERG